MGPGGAEIYIFNDERYLIADMWYWQWLLILLVLVVVTDFVEFCGYPLFLAVLADKMKQGKLIHD